MYQLSRKKKEKVGQTLKMWQEATSNGIKNIYHVKKRKSKADLKNVTRSDF